MKGKLWVVCPCYKDVPSFLRLREECAGAGAHFVVIDDSAGVDLETQKLAGLPDVTVITAPYNLGHQAAIVFGLRRMRDRIGADDLVVTMDSDGEDKPSDLAALTAPLLAHPTDKFMVCLARRTQRSETLLFKACYAVFRIIFRVATGHVIRNGNFAAFRGLWLQEMIYHPHFDQCYASTFISLPLHTTMVPLARGTRYFGKSKMGMLGLIPHGLRMFTPFTEKIAIRAMLFSGLLLALSLAAGFFAPLPPLYRWLAYFLAMYCVLLFAVAFLLFATFSQTKSRSLRGL